MGGAIAQGTVVWGGGDSPGKIVLELLLLNDPYYFYNPLNHEILQFLVSLRLILHLQRSEPLYFLVT